MSRADSWDVAIMAVSSAYRDLDVAGWHRHVNVQTEEHGETSPPCATPARMQRRVDVAVRKAASNICLWRYEDFI
jgi:hypothetical protein